MLHILLKNKPEGMTNEEFKKSWDNIGYTLSALNKTLEDMKGSLETVKTTDFDCPNHYAKLAFQAGQLEMLRFIQSILPETAK